MSTRPLDLPAVQQTLRGDLALLADIGARTEAVTVQINNRIDHILARLEIVERMVAALQPDR